MEITKEDLRMYRDLKLEIDVIQRQIDALYTPVSSVPLTSSGGTHSTTPSNPTERAVFRIDAQRKKLEHKQEELQDLTDRIDDWINEMDDHLVASIVRLHFVCGLTWRQTCKQVYGYPDPDVCRVTFNRYMEGRDGTKTN